MPFAGKFATLMIQGTGSNVGKSLLTAGLCRAFTRRGLKVRPFKPQNMSNNAAVTADGGEIGRAQALQARACGIAPLIDMNPVLLKPQGETGAQIVVQGRVLGNASAMEYQRLRPTMLPKALESFRRLSAEADLVLVEGAGSAAEVNLREGDIANMGFAEAANLPVVLVGDIERGGVIAQLVGTYALLNAEERRHLAGFIVNKFRGDPRLFDGGLAEIARRTGLPSFGIVPWLDCTECLPAEDSLALGGYKRDAITERERPIKIAVLCFPHIANFDDLDPLRMEPDVALVLVRTGEALPGDADLVILPGSKTTLFDLAFMRAQGWDIDLAAHRRRGGVILGICGGYQMLGTRIRDPEGIEGPPAEAAGLGFLDVDTILKGDKHLVAVEGHEVRSGAFVRGYEMHMGHTAGPGAARPLLILTSGPDGAVSAKGRVMGCYLHGLFASDAFRHAFLSRFRQREPSGIQYESQIENSLDRLAAHLEVHLDLDGLFEVARGDAIGPTRLSVTKRTFGRIK